MIPVLLVLLALAAVAGLAFLSPIRGAIAVIPLVLTHPVLTGIVIFALAAAVIAVGALIIGRNLRDFGWCLVVATAPTGRRA